MIYALNFSADFNEVDLPTSDLEEEKKETISLSSQTKQETAKLMFELLTITNVNVLNIINCRASLILPWNNKNAIK